MKEKPFLSVMIPCYRPSELLRETLQSAMTALGNLSKSVQLEIVDDASPDAYIPSMLSDWGFSNVIVHRRECTGGLAACWNTCIERANGELIHILHQDDLIAPDFYTSMTDAFQKFPNAGMAFCRVGYLNGGVIAEDDLEQSMLGIIPDWLSKICSRQRLQCPSVVVARTTYTDVGMFDDRLKYTIDWEMWIRIAAHFDVVYIPDILATYRVHEESETRRLHKAGMISRDSANTYRKLLRVLSGPEHSHNRESAKQFLLNISGAAISSAERLGEKALAMKELRSCLWNWWRLIPVRKLAEMTKWYLNLWFSNPTHV